MGRGINEEQRRDRRVSAEVPIRFRVIGGEGELARDQRSKTTNIAVRGVAFMTPLNIPIGSRIDLKISLPGRGNDLECEATVMRIVRDDSDGTGSEYGVQFDMDTIDDSSRLGRLVRSIDIVPLLEHMAKQRATDLHLGADMPPIYRINRKLVPGGKKKLSSEVVEKVIFGALSPEQRKQFEREKELYFPLVIPRIGRWRGSVFYQRGNIEATFQPIDLRVPTIAELNLPDCISDLALAEDGLIIVTGGSRSGKSTTLAAMIEAINQSHEKIIVTIENPIQYVHQNHRSIIKQREVGTDTHTVADGLKHILRQDPDVVLIDEITNSGIMDMAFRAAETGHLVMTAFPTNDIVSTINHILGLYRTERRTPALHAIASTLRGVISQRLVPSLDGGEMVLILEVVTVNDAIRNTIRIDKVDQLPNMMLSAPGSVSVDTSLRNLIRSGKIDFARASQISRDPEGLRRGSSIQSE